MVSADSETCPFIDLGNVLVAGVGATVGGQVLISHDDGVTWTLP